MNIHKKIIIPEEKKEEIIHYFKTNKNNTIKELSVKFEFSVYKIGRIITEHYDSIKTRD